MKKQYSCQRLEHGKTYRVIVTHKNGRVERIYHLIERRVTIKAFSEEDQAVFRQLENEIETMDFDIDQLGDSLEID